jgi:hypothetical protein
VQKTASGIANPGTDLHNGLALEVLGRSGDVAGLHDRALLSKERAYRRQG